MVSKNLKFEAMRLQEAKRAIKKLKQKRREGSRTVPSIPSTTMRAPVEEEKVSCFEKVTSKPVGAAENLLNEKKVRKEKKSRHVLKGSATTSNNQKDDIPQLFVDMSLREDDHTYGDTYEDLQWNSPALIPMRAVTKTYSKFPSVSSLDGNSPALIPMRAVTKTYCKFPSVSSPDGNTPALIPMPAVTRTYSECPSESSIQNVEVGVTNLDVPKFKPPKKVKAIKIKKPLKLNRKMVRKLKRPRAPMSVTMSSANSRGLVFSASSLDVTNETESETESLLNTEVLGLNHPKKGSKGAFRITTVPEETLPMSDGSDVQEECYEDEEEQDISPTSNNDEPDTCEVVPIVEKQPRNDPSKVQFHFIDGNIVIHLKHPASFVFCGQLQIDVLKGTVEILGYKVTSAGGPQTIFSPRGFSLLSLQTVLSDNECKVDFDSSSVMSLLQEGDAHDAFILLRKAESTLPFFLEQYVPTKLFPQLTVSETEDPFGRAGSKLQCICNPSQGSKIFQKGDLWDEVSDHVIQQQPGCTVVCGGKGVGKSTMLRFLVNRLLSSGKEEVLLIDLDPGQAEMTVPGCLSLTVIQKPLLGPNFTHLQSPEKCIYIGDINVSNCVSRYMEASVALINYWQSEVKFKTMPCLVNTMGFNKGLGITLMVQILSVLQPTSVIQILSKSNKRNYPELMSVDYVKRNCSNSPFRLKLDIQTLAQGRRLSCTSSINYDLHVLNSASESQTDQHHEVLGIDAKSSREIVILSYLSQVVTAPMFSLLNTVPYSCPMEFLYLSVCHESVPPPIILSVFNASLVALCSVNPKENDVVKSSVLGVPSVITKLPTANCLGFGIVRGIDMESKLLYLLTPVSPTSLISVNCLVVGAVSLPACVLLTPPKEPGPVPYVTIGESQRTAKPLKRSFRFSRYAANP